MCLRVMKTNSILLNEIFWMETDRMKNNRIVRVTR